MTVENDIEVPIQYYSRSVFVDDPKSTRRPKIDAADRTERIASLSSKIDEIEKHIETKQHLLNRANSVKDYFLCDKVQKEKRELSKEKERFEKEMKILKKKDARSKIYHKSKLQKQSSKTMVSHLPLPPKTVQSLDIRTLFATKSGGPSSESEMSSTSNTETATSLNGHGSADSFIDLCSDL